MSIYQFEILNKLGEGAFSSVYKVRRKSDGQIYALKKVKFAPMNYREKENALNEVRILASIDHPNIIAYKEAFFDEGTSSLCIVMEYAEGGDLLNKIENCKKRSIYFTENEILSTLAQTIRGLKALHDLKILHRDIKCANIFLTANGTVKIGDLNVSKVNKGGLAYTQTGTPYYASPEVWQDKPYNSSSDIWSLGCVIYEMTTLRPPFTGVDMKALYRKVIKGLYQPIPVNFSAELSNVIKMMLQIRPNARPSCEKLLEMPFALRERNFKYNAEADSELLNTIKFEPSMKVLSNRLPGPNYERRGRGLSARGSKEELDKENQVNTQKLRDALSSDPERHVKLRQGLQKNRVRLPLIPLPKPF
ncbi:unnamed protein product [Blepharisma stoltei]|uniref:non-specific serine/threonine protein kinase n=1 Tax=Blepharisma stoltei TaxID=1481888 RepID=A0AAU9ITC9_9CILI|nr:unnamed protein product [Blepharisma stoltei]